MLTRTRQSDIRHRRAGLSLHTRQAAARILHPDPPSSNATRTRPHTVTADRSHTAAYRMARDPQMPLTDVQWVLGHAHLSTTQRYLNPVTEDVIAELLAYHLLRRDRDPATSQAPGYRAESLQILFGEAGS
jgi:site-specific recombinase XerD